MKNSKTAVDDEILDVEEELAAPVVEDYDGRKKAELERSRRSYKVRKGIEDFFEQRRIRDLLGDEEF